MHNNSSNNNNNNINIKQGRTFNILIGCTGSVASLKIPKLVEELLASKYKVCVKIVTTKHAQHFFDKNVLPVEIFCDEDEWTTWKSVEDPILHIELRRWADILVIAPLDANTLGKIACGLCDNLLTCIVRAWQPDKPLLFAPAMNTMMWNHPITANQVQALKSFGYKEIPCIEKVLACRDKGLGAMAETATIVKKVEEHLEKMSSNHYYYFY
ncbi:hypothetical protein HELRODRAFT_70216 [Helobdella robusta]|uniref:Phosphopantothenoylcysteine decarboxylase n=1 Tax=Helobdella robusta TaxID=6412 RepID=T1G034_HELRO|nr:hypothetical protein HELRODRAFT_70216 [Helobdella robusta]ESN91617.1 hypothetical protein HELRODRAFT_70216 [Helobdella robusta]